MRSPHGQLFKDTANITTRSSEIRYAPLFQCNLRTSLWLSGANLTRSYPSNVQKERSQGGEKILRHAPEKGRKILSVSRIRMLKKCYDTLNLTFICHHCQACQEGALPVELVSISVLIQHLFLSRHFLALLHGVRAHTGAPIFSVLAAHASPI